MPVELLFSDKHRIITANEQSQDRESLLGSSIHRGARLRILLRALLVAWLTGISTYLVWEHRAKASLPTREMVNDLEWELRVDDYSRYNDTIRPEIGVIQFLRKGYSIQLEEAQYTQEGLKLSGRIGNPTNLLLNSLTLSFSARKAVFTEREKYFKGKQDAKGEWIMGPSPAEIGKAQTSVGSLFPGSTSLFFVTIPNVKQTSEALDIVIYFSGERYSYVK